MSKLQAKGKKVVDSDDSSSEEEVVVKKQKVTDTKANTKAPAKPAKKVADSDEESSEEEIIKPTKAVSKVAAKTAQKNGKKAAVDGDTSDTSEEPVKKPAAKKAAAKKQESSSEDDEPAPPKKKTAAPAKPVKKAVSSDEESEEEKPVKKAPVKAAAKPVKKAVSSDEESEEDVKPVKKAATPKTTPKIDDSLTSSADEDEKPVKKAAPAKTQPRKASKQMEVEEDSDDSDATPKAKKAAPVKTQARKASKQIEEEEESSEEEPKVKTVAPVQAKQQVPQENGNNAQAHEVIVKGLPFAVTDKDIREYFAECGTIARVNLLKGPDGRSKGIAFVGFESESSVATAISWTGSDFGGRTVQIEKTTPKENRAAPARDFGQKSERDPNSASIFVGNLSFQTTEESLRAFFESCGEIVGARVAIGQDGNPRGFGHVDFAATDSVDKAIAKAGQNLDGRPIRVDFSAGKKQGGGDRGGFGGGRGGFGGGRGGFGGGRGGPQRMNLGEEDANKKKGSISSFQGQKQRL